jgi:putative FmdB family regulatory protein
MPIYEFYCPDCNTLFNFLSRTVNTAGRPPCPRCGKKKLQRRLSLFSTPGRAGSEGGPDELPIDDARMEKAMESLAREAEYFNEDDPRQAANLMRKFSRMTGVEFGEGMQEALRRMEAGEDPEAIEAEMGDVLNEEEPILGGEGGGMPGAGSKSTRSAPARDPKLYDL